MSDIKTVKTYMRMQLFRNDEKIVGVTFEPNDESYTRYASEIAVLATGMSSPQEISLGDIGASLLGKYFALKTDRSIQLAIDNSANLVTLSANGGIMYVGTFSHIYVKNSGSTEATIEYVASDGTSA